MNSYKNAADYLGKKDERPYTRGRLQFNRIQRRTADSIAMELHGHDVVVWHQDGRTVLDSCGWRTPTTKERMNECVPFGGVSQRKGQWYFSTGPWDDRTEFVFEDNMVLNSDGSVSGVGSPDTVKKNKKLRTQIQKFSADFTAALYRGEISQPGPGDCFGCQFHEKGKPGGKMMGMDHYLSHISKGERYFVPSMLSNAMQAMGASQAMNMTIAAHMNKEPERAWPEGARDGKEGFIHQGIRRQLTRFLYRELGIA